MVITLIKPQNYDWEDFKKNKLALEKLEDDLTTAHDNPASAGDREAVLEDQPHKASVDDKEMKRWTRIAAFFAIATFLGHWVLWPLPMYGAQYVFEKKVSVLTGTFN